MGWDGAAPNLVKRNESPKKMESNASAFLPIFGSVRHDVCNVFAGDDVACFQEIHSFQNIVATLYEWEQTQVV